MLYVARRPDGWLEGCAEVRLVDEHGQFDPYGEYAWVEQVELSPGVKSRTMFRQMMMHFGTWLPTAKYAYWVRRDKDEGKRIHTLSRARLERELQKEVRVHAAV